MKKFTSIILIIVCIISYMILNTSFNVNAALLDSNLITENHRSYKDGNKYSGKQIAPHIDVGEFADFDILNHGGTHVDGAGNEVFLNYVVFNVNLNFNSTTKEI